MSFDIKRRLAINHKKNSLNSKKPFWSMSKIRERKNRRMINERKKKENECNNMRIKKEESYKSKKKNSKRDGKGKLFNWKKKWVKENNK